MPHVAALYRYPVKGFTPEECDILTVLDEGRIASDRVLGVRFADTEAADHGRRSPNQSSTAIKRQGDAPPFLINRGSTIIFTRFLEI